METIIIISLLILIQLELIAIIAIKQKGIFKRGLNGAVFIDTSALIDGRVLVIATMGFLPPKVAIPRSVVNELQLLADGSDSDKRTKARHGLDVVAQLRELSTINVVMLEDIGSIEGVDRHLLTLAARHQGSICTIDFNLAKVAAAENIAVLNINDLARQLKINYLPGEKVSLTIIQKGNEQQQGIGYLADGTMVVVDKAQKNIGETIEVEFIRSLQTAAGKMLFAKKVSAQISAKTSASAGKGRRKLRSTEESFVELANKAD